jgi:peptide/nickel transport system permease protein
LPVAKGPYLRALKPEQLVFYWVALHPSTASTGGFGETPFHIVGDVTNHAIHVLFKEMTGTIHFVMGNGDAFLFMQLCHHGYGIGLGVYTGIKRDNWVSRAVMAVSLVGVSLPTFIIGIALIYLFAVHLRWLPSSGRSGTIELGFWKTSLLSVDGWRAIVLPAITLSLFQLTMILRLVRAEMLEVMRTDYIKFARARGLAERSIYFVHALRNTLVPVMTVIGLNIGGLIAYSVITETVFQWPGTGLMFIQAVDFVDVPIMAAYLIFVALLFVVINLIVDILYFLVDPRIRLGGS